MYCQENRSGTLIENLKNNNKKKRRKDSTIRIGLVFQGMQHREKVREERISVCPPV